MGESNMLKKITSEVYEHVIEKRELEIYLQPIVSLNKERIIGCEALLRAGYRGEPIAADAIFSYVRKNKKECELDFICREEALKQYIKINQDMLLFINFESALLQEYMNNMIEFVQLLEQLGIQKERIVIEINEKRTVNDNLLIEFVTSFRKQGFLIALDDVGEGYSNLNRIILTHPDIIKIDRNTIKALYQNYYKYEILRSITALASRIGAVVIAEGAEEEEEVLSCLSLGISNIQGYYFSKAIPAKEFLDLNYYEKIYQLSCRYKVSMEEKMINNIEQGVNRKITLYNLMKLLRECKINEYETVICSFFEKQDGIECIYVIDDSGKQITKTLFHAGIIFKSKYLFTPAKENDHHILKPYYYVVKHKKSDIYVSERYISAATGHFCETYSCIFYSCTQEEFILCMDYEVNE
jgi:FOG: EAL domain